jgi:hypothetical protein
MEERRGRGMKNESSAVPRRTRRKDNGTRGRETINEIQKNAQSLKKMMTRRKTKSIVEWAHVFLLRSIQFPLLFCCVFVSSMCDHDLLCFFVSIDGWLFS